MPTTKSFYADKNEIFDKAVDFYGSKDVPEISKIHCLSSLLEPKYQD